MFTIGKSDPTGRVPPGQRVTEKFPVMTVGAPDVTPAERWTLTLAVEAEDMTVTELATWNYAAFDALPQREIVCDIHCVTRWSKLDTRWRGVAIDDILAAGRAEAHLEQTNAAGGLPLAYVSAECDGGYAANLRLADLRGDLGFVGLSLDAGGGLAPLERDHGGPARLVTPRLYFWKSAKWLRRLVLTPYDRKGYWERLGYHNYGDPWKEQRYRGLSERDHRTTLDPELSRAIRRERLGRDRR